MDIKPIRPDEVATQKLSHIPGEVIKAFNELISQNYTNGRAIVKQDDVLALIVKLRTDDVTRQDVFDNGWLNVEEIYRAAGWKVEYDKPGYSESYPATFMFSGK